MLLGNPPILLMHPEKKNERNTLEFLWCCFRLVVCVVSFFTLLSTEKMFIPWLKEKTTTETQQPPRTSPNSVGGFNKTEPRISSPVASVPCTSLTFQWQYYLQMSCHHRYLHHQVIRCLHHHLHCILRCHNSGRSPAAAADGICCFCSCLFSHVLFSRFWEANNLGRKKFQPVCQWFVWISCFSLTFHENPGHFTWRMKHGGWLQHLRFDFFCWGIPEEALEATT